ncbi:MAG: hypothetical protein ACXVB4_17220 [Pseudobdellovibrionaceae bacterium]
MKSKSLKLIFSLSVCTLLTIAFNNCTKNAKMDYKAESTTVGNPMTELGSYKILKSVCKILTTCHPELVEITCLDGIRASAGVGESLGLPSGNFATYEAVITAESAGQVSMDPAATDSCVSNIQQLTCANSAVAKAYDPNLANPFANVPLMLPQVPASCPTTLTTTIDPPKIAKSCSYDDVKATVDAAAAGETVQIPAGTCVWTTTLAVAKGIKILGAGIGSTIIQDKVPKGGPTCSGGGGIFEFTVNSPENFRVSNLTIAGGDPVPQQCGIGSINLYGTSKVFRVDHLEFTGLQQTAIAAHGNLTGVIDHARFSGPHMIGIFVDHQNWLGAENGDGSWADDLHLGTEQAVYIEDCVFDASLTSGLTDAITLGAGGRVVARYNTFTETRIGIFGTDTSGRSRAGRSFEIISNNFNLTKFTNFDAVWIGGGTGVIAKNTVNNTQGAIAFLNNYRDSNSYTPWGQCDGNSIFDGNLTGQTGYPCLDQVGRGKGLLYLGLTPSPNQTAAQNAEPLYLWENTKSGAPLSASSQSAHIQLNRDYFDGLTLPSYLMYTYPHPSVK